MLHLLANRYELLRDFSEFMLLSSSWMLWSKNKCPFTMDCCNWLNGLWVWILFRSDRFTKVGYWTTDKRWIALFLLEKSINNVCTFWFATGRYGLQPRVNILAHARYNNLLAVVLMVHTREPINLAELLLPFLKKSARFTALDTSECRADGRKIIRVTIPFVL